MKFLRHALAALLMAAALPALANDYTYLAVDKTDGRTTVEISNIDKITFDTADMVVYLSNGGEQRFPLANLSKLFFTGEAAGIATVQSSASKIHYDGQVLRVEVTNGERIGIYNIKGQQIFSSNKTTTLDLSNMPKGIYIVKAGKDDTMKIMNHR